MGALPTYLIHYDLFGMQGVNDEKKDHNNSIDFGFGIVWMG